MYVKGCSVPSFPANRPMRMERGSLDFFLISRPWSSLERPPASEVGPETAPPSSMGPGCRNHWTAPNCTHTAGGDSCVSPRDRLRSGRAKAARPAQYMQHAYVCPCRMAGQMRAAGLQWAKPIRLSCRFSSSHGPAARHRSGMARPRPTRWTARQPQRFQGIRVRVWALSVWPGRVGSTARRQSLRGCAVRMCVHTDSYSARVYRDPSHQALRSSDSLIMISDAMSGGWV